MIYNSSDNTTYVVGSGKIYQDPFIAEDGLTHEQIVRSHMKRYKVFDADTSGSETVHFRFDDGLCFEEEYSWWWQDSHPKNEYYDGWNLQDEFYQKKISSSKCSVPESALRAAKVFKDLDLIGDMLFVDSEVLTETSPSAKIGHDTFEVFNEVDQDGNVTDMKIKLLLNSYNFDKKVKVSLKNIIKDGFKVQILTSPIKEPDTTPSSMDGPGF